MHCVPVPFSFFLQKKKRKTNKRKSEQIEVGTSTNVFVIAAWLKPTRRLSSNGFSQILLESYLIHSPRTDKLPEASDDPRLFVAVQVNCPASL